VDHLNNKICDIADARCIHEDSVQYFVLCFCVVPATGLLTVMSKYQ